jgi:chitodextrinase
LTRGKFGQLTKIKTMQTQSLDVQTGEITTTPWTAEEIAAHEAWVANEKPTVVLAELRRRRDERLAETDWWVVGDRTATAEQLAYRQALRDLPANTTDPENPVWPTKP